ncbi:MAG TPA: GNAT family protein [Vicinamibacterales bacterium]|nr:GNAT family protein [Vicinamibacterales bacterium]
MLRLEGERCCVRPWLKSDAASLVEHADNINVAKCLRDRFPHPYTHKDASEFLKHAAASADPSNLAIDVNGAAVGGIGYVAGRDVERYSAEIGYWLGETLWGRGIVSEALVLVTAHAFAELNFLRLFALPFADNPGSIRVLEKAGYLREGVLRSSSVKFGLPKDQIIYAAVNPRWRAPLVTTRPGAQ